MNDLNIIKQLEQEIGRKLQKRQEITKIEQTGYVLNKEKQVTELNLHEFEIGYVPNTIFKLKELRVLVLYNNQLKELPAWFGQLQNLSVLDLGENQLKELPAWFGQLQNLSSLDLRNNQLKELPAWFGQLQNLSRLWLNGNQLKELPASFGQLQNLNYLDLDGNQLKELPASFGQLQNLNYLDLDGNQLKELPAWFGQLQNLQKLCLNNNEFKQLPEKILDFNLELYWENCYDFFFTQKKESGITLEGNPLKRPFPEIIQQERQTIIEYFDALEQGEPAPANEAKVLILGQGGVGKTSLVNRLLHGIYDDNENKTEGINVNKWYVNIDNENIRLNVWDFGGQEIMHATHQFFLTKRSLYILLLDARQGEKDSRLEYWLKIIQTYGGDSPILLAINKTDQHHINLNEKFLTGKYPNIKGFYNISCKTENGLDALKTAIETHINELPHVHDILPKTWFDLKQQIEKIRRDSISFDEYLKICKKHNITESNLQHILIKLLHDLGIVLNFRDDEKRPQLRNVNILKPSWATDAIYKLINCNILFKNKGVLEVIQLNNLLDNKRYPEDKHYVLLQLMEKFELCFKMPDMEQESYLIADLLDPQEPDTDWDYDDCLRFEYHYDVLPSSVFSRFLVRVHEYISQKTYWLTGVMLAHENNKALIKADIEDKKIMIWVNGTTQTRRVLLGIIRGHFKVIHNSFAKLIIDERVPYKKTHVSYNRLLKLEQKKIKTEYLDEIDEEINVQEILNGLIAPENREQERKEKRMINDRGIHFHGDVKNVNVASGDKVKQNMTVNEASDSKSDEKPKKEWAGRRKLILQVLATLASVGIAFAALYKLFFAE